MDRRSFLTGLGAALATPLFEPRRVYSFPSWPPRSIDAVPAVGPFCLKDIAKAIYEMRAANEASLISYYKIVEQSLTEDGSFKMKVLVRPFPQFIRSDLDKP